MAEEVKYLVTFTKQTAMTGEQITIQTNLPKSTTSEQLGLELIEIGKALDLRLAMINEDVIARTGKTLDDLGLTGKIKGFPKKD